MESNRESFPLELQQLGETYRIIARFLLQPEKAELPRQKRKYEKKPKLLPLSSGVPHHAGPIVFNAKDLNQYDFPSSDEEPFSQVRQHLD